MAISLKASSAAWGTADAALTLVGTPAAGDRYLLWATWKDCSTTTAVSGWTKITEYADGVIASAASVGSVKVACWYRDWQSGDGAADIVYTAGGTGGLSITGTCMQLWQKGSSDTWSTPVFQTGNWPSQSTGLAAASSAAVDIGDGAVVIATMGVRNDSASFTRPTDGIDRNSGGTPTWNGNYVESPATHLSTTTGDDLSTDGGYRLVTTGASAVVLEVNVTALSAAETGVVLWVVQGITTAGATVPGRGINKAPGFRSSLY